jgi:hypothetical protein
VINVTGCQIHDGGTRRVWFFNDNSQVVELMNVPLRLRLKFYNASNNTIRTKDVQAEMKRAIERFKKLRGIK